MNKNFDKKEYMKEYMQEYVNNNKDKLNEKILCELCGKYYMRRFRSVHIKTKKHEYMKQIKDLQDKVEMIKKNC